MRNKKILVWYRNDLRVRDQEALYKASEKGNVYAVYCFDPRQFAQTELGFSKTGPFRAQFLLQSVADLRENLRKLGGDLIVRTGHPEDVIPELANQLSADAVFASKEVTDEETRIEDKLEKNLLSRKIAFELFWQATLYHIHDIPWPIKNLPDVFTQFRKETEGSTKIRQTFPTPKLLNPIEEVDAGKMPDLQELGLSPINISEKSVLAFQGGETAAWNRVQEYFWENDQLKNYKETRNGMLGADYSSKLSAWLANGSISPRSVYEEVKKYENERTSNDSTYWLVFELLWRDYFRFVARKYGNQIFRPGGIHEENLEYNQDKDAFEKWKDGETGIPFIDANMREINATGYMSNRGRQNVASFLTKDLKVNWTWGASYFESLLIDYDVCSNWGNWNYIAGVGNDPRKNRYFNIISQATHYDPQGEYVRYWIPVLSGIEGRKIHTPTELSPEELKNAKVDINSNYPAPMVSFDKWIY